MAITFDKNRYKKLEKWIAMGKKKYSLRTAFIQALFFSIFMVLFKTLTFDRDEFTVNKLLFEFFFYFVFMFAFNYFFNYTQWINIENEYNITKEYWEKTDPEFLK